MRVLVAHAAAALDCRWCPAGGGWPVHMFVVWADRAASELKLDPRTLDVDERRAAVAIGDRCGARLPRRV